MVVVRPPDIAPPARPPPDAGVISDARARHRRHRAVAVLAVGAVVAVTVLATGGGGAHAGRASASSAGPPIVARVDARWRALERCLVRAQHAQDAANGGLPGHVAQGRARLEVYSDPQPGYRGLTWILEYRGTFRAAKATASDKPKRLNEMVGGRAGMGTSAGLAIGNVAYYYTGWDSTPEGLAVTGCLDSTYRNQPRWPANLDPARLATWHDSLYP